jgi:DNA-binding NarL/FixJ family response regulator
MTSTTKAPSALHKRRVYVVDDHPIVRQGLAQFIAHEPDIEVCGGAANVNDALEEIAAMRPDLVIIDISLEGSNGIDLINQLKTRNENTKALVWSMFDEKLFAERALRAGALGYINKQEPIDTVVTAIRQVLQGDVYLSPGLAAYLVHRVGGMQPLDADPVSSLSDRELEVFEMIGRGMTTQEIARQLGLSAKTIETHRERIKVKLRLRNAAELSREAVLWILENG